MKASAQESETDRIVRRTVLRASRSRVWKAITDAKQFGTWFGLEASAPFVAGTKVEAKIVPTQVDDAIAEKQKGVEGITFPMWIEEVVPERRFSFRWHPGGDPPEDPENEPTTLVTFELEEVEGGVQLTVTESGFDRIPLAKRAKAFESNSGGWTIQMQLVEKYLARTAA